MGPGPHTEAKDRVLRGYFDAWFPIMLSTFPRLTVLERYAGPGTYNKGEDGSRLSPSTHSFSVPNCSPQARPFTRIRALIDEVLGA